jgi:hypothetical protein
MHSTEKDCEPANGAEKVGTLGANHFVFLSNETDVLRNMSALLAELH